MVCDINECLVKDFVEDFKFLSRRIVSFYIKFCYFQATSWVSIHIDLKQPNIFVL